jgi:hypothetical protein
VFPLRYEYYPSRVLNKRQDVDTVQKCEFFLFLTLDFHSVHSTETRAEALWLNVFGGNATISRALNQRKFVVSVN